MESFLKRKSEDTLESLKTKQRVVLEVDQKREIINFHDENPSWSQQKLADFFSEKFQLKTKIARNTISTILSKRNLYLNGGFSNQSSNGLNSSKKTVYDKSLLEKCLLLWYSNLDLASKSDLTDQKVTDQAKKFAIVIGVCDFSTLDFSIERLENLKNKFEQLKNTEEVNLIDSSNIENSQPEEFSSSDNDENMFHNECKQEAVFARDDEIEGEKDGDSSNFDGDSNYLDEIADLAKQSNENESYDQPIANETYAQNLNYAHDNNPQNDQETLFDTSWKKKRVVFVLDQKREIILFHDKNPALSQQTIADFFSNKFHFSTKIARNTISTILSKRNVYLQTGINHGTKHLANLPVSSKSLLSNFNRNLSCENEEIDASNANNFGSRDFMFSNNNNISANDYNLTIEEIIELAKESEYNDITVNSNEEHEQEHLEDTPIKIEPKVYTKGEALLGLENIQGLLIQGDLLEETDLEYISKLRAKLDLIN